MRRPTSSTRTMLPPPAPISERSTNGRRIGCPPPLIRRLLRLMPAPISYSLVRTGSPASSIAALAVVPPMSSEMRFSIPVERAMWAQATTPAAGPRLDEVSRLCDRGGRAHQRTAGLHDLERRGETERLQCRAEPSEIAPQRRPDVRVDHGGARTLVLARLGQDLRRARDVERIADDLPDDLGGAQFVPRIGVRVQEADGERLVAIGEQALGDAHNLGLVERSPDLAVRAESLRDLEASAPGHERRRLLVLEVVEHRDAQTPHLEDVTKPARGDERRTRPLALDHRVRRDGRRMDDPPNRSGRDVGLLEERPRAVDDTRRVVLRRGEDLLGQERPVVSE